MGQVPNLKEVKEYRKLVKQRLSAKRFEHSLSVSEQAEKLAHCFGADSKKAILAGLLHDCCKEMKPADQLQYLHSHDIILDDWTYANPKVWHAITGALWVEKEWGITDTDIIGAIRWHTTAKSEMSLLEETVYLADATSSDRKYSEADQLRDLLPKQKNEAMFFSISMAQKNSIKNNLFLIDEANAAYNYYLKHIDAAKRSQ